MAVPTVLTPPASSTVEPSTPSLTVTTASPPPPQPSPPPSTSPSSPVVVSLSTLNGNALPLPTLTSAFGPSSLGIIIIKDLPPRFLSLRLQVLQYSSYLAHLPPAELERLTVPRAKYLTGWSHGVETLRSGRKDSLKGSWYANCAFYHDRPSAVRVGALAGNGSIEAKIADLAIEAEQREQKAKEARERRGRRARDGAGEGDINDTVRGVGLLHGSETPDEFPEYTSPNVWPQEDMLPGFRSALEELCSLIIDVAVLVARQCDRFAADTEIEGYEKGYLERVVSTSRTTKARLLHYFPPRKAANEANGSSTTEPRDDGGDDDDGWCTTHKDHGCLTGLTSALFIDESSPEPVLKADGAKATNGSGGDGEFVLPQLNVLKQSPDPDAGLYIRSRTGELVKVAIPPDCLAFQTGEALERVTKGKFAAVPHFVRGPQPGKADGMESVARNTLAVFTQPNLSESVDEYGTTFAQFAKDIVAKNTVG